LYLNSACFHDVIHGDNGAFRARMGADPCTGLGTPIGELLEERIQPAAIHASRVRGLIAENAQLRATIAGVEAGAGAHEPGTIPRTLTHAIRLGLRPSKIGYNDLPAQLRAGFVQMSDVGAQSGSYCGSVVGPDPNTSLVCYKNTAGQCTWYEVPRAAPPASHD
jgi:hypothetical protein